MASRQQAGVHPFPTLGVAPTPRLEVFYLEMSMPSPQRRRTVFDLSPQELLTLHGLNRSVSATVPPKRPRLSADAGSYSEYELDWGIYERFRDLHARAKAERSDWLRAQRITHKVAAQAALCGYQPYKRAARLGLEAPPMPEGYAETFQALLQKLVQARQAARPPKPPAQPLAQAGALQMFSF